MIRNQGAPHLGSVCIHFWRRDFKQVPRERFNMVSIQNNVRWLDGWLWGWVVFLNFFISNIGGKLEHYFKWASKYEIIPGLFSCCRSILSPFREWRATAVSFCMSMLWKLANLPTQMQVKINTQGAILCITVKEWTNSRKHVFKKPTIC